MDKNRSKEVINRLFVNVFNDILYLEENFMNKRLVERVTINEVHVMEAIELSEKKSMGSVAKRLMVTEGTLTTSINRLVKKEYIERNRDEKDKRVFLLSLTEKGKNVMSVHGDFHDLMVDFVNDDPSIDENLIDSLVSLQKFFSRLKETYKK
ncbi:MarR family transcriptional regulator [Mycoplasmatota bacterium WC44]